MRPISEWERFLAWLVTGPVGRLLGFLAEATVALWQLATRRKRARD